MNKEKLIIIKDNQGVIELLDYLADKEFVALDTETTGVTASAEIIGYSIAAERDVGYYVITAYWDVEAKELKYLETKDSASEVMLSLKDKQLIMHNGVFDCEKIHNNYKVSLIDSLHTDTMVMASLIDENRSIGLKELGTAMYGESAKEEQSLMKESVSKNGGQLTKACYELYKADSELIARYGAKDAILTFRIFEDLLPQLIEEGMEDFFYVDESMPLLRSVTYQLNTTGIKVDVEKMMKLKRDLEVESLELQDFIDKEITPTIEEKYPATNLKNTFNIDSREQLAWLLFDKLGNRFEKLSNSGADLCAVLDMKRPYNVQMKNEFIDEVKNKKGFVWRKKGTWNPKQKREMGEAKVKDYWTYLSTDKVVLGTFANKYEWVEKLLQLKKVDKLLSTIEGIYKKLDYGIIRPSFLQCGTTSGRYSSRSPNYQNLPRDDSRLKSCMISRPGKVFVGADYSSLEPRVYASYSKDERLINCFKDNQDFYSVIGKELFNKQDASLYKKDPNYFGKKYEDLRQKCKVVSLSSTYGTTAHKMASSLGVDVREAQHTIDQYFAKFPRVQMMMLEAHELVKKQGYVENLFGRKRRIPEAMHIPDMYGSLEHSELPYQARNLLNLSVNHRIQSTGASVINRASIRFLDLCKEAGIDAKIVLQVHDSLVAECNEADAETVNLLMKEAMENTVELPGGVPLLAEPSIGLNLAEVK